MKEFFLKMTNKKLDLRSSVVMFLLYQSKNSIKLSLENYMKKRTKNNENKNIKNTSHTRCNQII